MAQTNLLVCVEIEKENLSKEYGRRRLTLQEKTGGGGWKFTIAQLRLKVNLKIKKNHETS